MKINLVTVVLLSLFVVSCNDSVPSNQQDTTIPNFINKGHELIYKMVQKVGNYKALMDKKDVIYTYTYQTPDGKTDISTEKYIFDGEYSYGKYEQHERTLTQLNGVIEQGFDGNGFWLKHNGELLSDESMLKRVAFNRPTNFYWFAMFQKLLDLGLNYKYLGEKTIENQVYDIVKVTFVSAEDKPTDIYQLYINQQTSLVDQFLFTVADFGVMETPFLMKLGYKKIDGLLMPVERKYKKSNWEAAVSEEPWIVVNWSDIKFKNGLDVEIFKK